jgi:hypothetical protein
MKDPSDNRCRRSLHAGAHPAVLPRERHRMGAGRRHRCDGDHDAHHRPSPTGFGWHPRARAAVFVVPGVGTDAETSGAVRSAASKGRRDRRLRMEPSVVGAPQTAEIETPPPGCAPKKSGNRVFLTNIHRWGGSIVKITTLIIVLLGLATASGAAMIVSVKKEPVLLACGGPNC